MGKEFFVLGAETGSDEDWEKGGWNEVFAVSWNEALNEMKYSRQGNMGGSAISTLSFFMERRASSRHRVRCASMQGRMASGNCVVD